MKTLTGHDGPVLSAAFDPTGTYVLSCSTDGTARLWDKEAGSELLSFFGLLDNEWVIASAGGFYNASENGARYVNVRSNHQVTSLDAHSKELFQPETVREVLRSLFF